jgi:hypothetical protein
VSARAIIIRSSLEQTFLNRPAHWSDNKPDYQVTVRLYPHWIGISLTFFRRGIVIFALLRMASPSSLGGAFSTSQDLLPGRLKPPTRQIFVANCRYPARDTTAYTNTCPLISRHFDGILLLATSAADGSKAENYAKCFVLYSSLNIQW